MLIHQDRLFPAEPAAREVARRLYAEPFATCRSSRRTGIPIRAGIAENEPFSDPATLFVIPDHYIFRMLYSQGVRLEDLGISHEGGRYRRARSAGDLAPFCVPLSSLPRHAHPRLARPYLRDPVRLRRAALGRERGRLLRPDRRGAAHAGIPSARAFRALPHRGHRHHREPARSAEAPRDDPAIGLEGAGGHGLSARSGRRSGIRRISRRTSCASAR